MRIQTVGLLNILWVALFTLSLGLSSAEGAMSLQAKIDYMERVKQEAVDLEERGYYDDSVEKSLEVQRLAEEIDVIIAVLKKWNLLQRNIAVAKQIGADRVSPDEFELAVDYYKSAEQAFIDEDLEQAEFDIDDGLYYIGIAIENTRESFNQQQDSDVPREMGNVEVEKVGNSQYVVRLIPQKRDCLWRIAEYEFIYGNPWEWKRIYNANRDIIEDPDLIYPGQKLIIPPLPYEFDLE